MHTRLIILLSILIVPKFFYGQSESFGSSYFWFDAIIGQTNSGIFKGVAYTNEFRIINERNQFYNKADFETGSVTYDGQPYLEVPLKYDAYNDQLLIRNEALATTPIMIFDTEQVSDFKIGEDAFDFVETVSSRGNELSGFFEILLRTDSLLLYKKHTKKLLKRTDEQRVYYEFKNKHFYVIRYRDDYFEVNRAKGLNGIFPDRRKSISAIRRRHALLRKSDQDAYMKAILKDFTEEMSKNTNEGL